MVRPIYIIAVSGGVDSVVLLDMIAGHLEISRKNIHNNHSIYNNDDSRIPMYVVAHVDHGIRIDSKSDANYVENLAKKYQIPYESIRLELGSRASEEKARIARYEFLFKIMNKYKADAVITAHHQDDVLETMVVNLLRGTGARGLVGFSQKNILRPLLNKSKQQLIEYANEHNLEWRDDSTNADISYKRNEVRLRYMPLIGKFRGELLTIRNNVEVLYEEIDSLTKKLLVQTLQRGELLRSRFVVLPYVVQKELMASWLRINNVEIDKKIVEKAVISAKTLLPGKHVELAKDAKLYSDKKTVVLKVHQSHV